MQHLGHNEDEVKTVIQPGESVEYELGVYTKIDSYDYLAPLGVYDVYLYNGEVYRKALTIVENM